jgi:DNA-directed RNA polymerase subunit RPC12/RpoP
MLVAEFQDEEIFPADLPNDIANTNTCGGTDGPVPRCPKCGEQVTHRDQGANGKVAHFAHCPQSYGGCSGSTVGESAEHRAMKSIAVGTVEAHLSVPVSESGTEQEVSAPHSDKEHRRADGLIRFDCRDEQLGDGLAIEVQYRNEQKDAESATLDYIRGNESLAVLWLWEDDFEMTADSPEDWALPLGDAGDIRKLIREQIWPAGTGTAIWRSVRQTADRRADPPIPRHTGVRRPEVGHAAVQISEARPSKPQAECLAHFPTHTVDEIAQRYKERTSWSELFRAELAQTHIRDVRQQMDLPNGYVRASLHPQEWLSQAELLEWLSETSVARDYEMTYKCAECSGRFLLAERPSSPPAPVQKHCNKCSTTQQFYPAGSPLPSQLPEVKDG